MSSVARFNILPFIPLLIMGLFEGLMVAPAGIYNAEFLVSRGFVTETVGFVFIFSASVSIVVLLMLPYLLSHFKAKHILLSLSIIMALAAAGLSQATAIPQTAVAFLFFTSLSVAIYMLIDLFIEAKIADSEGITGRARGLYLMFVNIAFTMGPIIAGVIITNHSYEFLYGFSAVMCLVFTGLAFWVIRDIREPHFPRVTPRFILQKVIGNALVRKVLAINLLLQMRYAVVILYLALYLNKVLGFSLTEVGLIVTIANIPFILIQYPLGMIGDKWLGERELLTCGFVLTCIGGFMLAFIPTTSVIQMIGFLLIMFTGAAIIEVMSESYFFKHVKSKDDAHIVAFRVLIPLSMVITPPLSAAVMYFLPLNYVFAAIAAICTLGIPLSMSLKDTR